jgi:hypothetical protein
VRVEFVKPVVNFFCMLSELSAYFCEVSDSTRSLAITEELYQALSRLQSPGKMRFNDGALQQPWNSSLPISL